MNLFNYLNRQKRWSKNTFGDTPRTEGILKHIEKEIEEVRQAPNDLEEWCDIAILALDGAWRAGFTPHEICQMMEAKQAKNFTREYPKTLDDVPSEHVREVVEPQTCKFDIAWVGACGKEADGSGYCEAHRGKKCSVCGAQANRECSHTGQFVCGAPLCKDCEGYQTEKNSFGGEEHGAWGFLRHSHRRKEVTE